MIALLAAMLLTSPAPQPLQPAQLRCVTSCAQAIDRPGHECWFDVLPDCGGAPICIDGAELKCTPLRVDLGWW